MRFKSVKSQFIFILFSDFSNVNKFSASSEKHISSSKNWRCCYLVILYTAITQRSFVEMIFLQNQGQHEVNSKLMWLSLLLRFFSEWDSTNCAIIWNRGENSKLKRLRCFISYIYFLSLDLWPLKNLNFLEYLQMSAKHLLLSVGVAFWQLSVISLMCFWTRQT